MFRGYLGVLPCFTSEAASARSSSPALLISKSGERLMSGQYNTLRMQKITILLVSPFSLCKHG
jgi:hypothetical protein